MTVVDEKPVSQYSPDSSRLDATLKVLYLTGSETLLNQRDHRKRPLPDNSVVSFRGYSVYIRDFPDEEL